MIENLVYIILESLFSLRLKMMMCCVPIWKQLLEMLFTPLRLSSVLRSSLQDDIIQEIKTANFYSILADEVTDCANLEQHGYVRHLHWPFTLTVRVTS